MIRQSLTLLSLCLLVLGTSVRSDTRVPQSSAEITLGFAPLVKEAAPAVVNIYAKIVTQSRGRSPFMDDPFFEDLFRGFNQPRPRVENSLGSGVILTADGVVVSNYHVVGMASEIRVVTNDRREFNARVVLADQASDLAILQLDDADNLPYLDLRDSDQVEVGELVLAIGNPFGVGQTVSSGIVSGLARTGTASGDGLGYFVQTDAPINPGNSGGALVDVNGDLIGINTRILSRSGGSNGIGFAIPANLVREFVRQAQRGAEDFERPWAGMSGQPMDADLANSLGLDLVEGMMISNLHPQSPFAEAGFVIGDVITQVDGKVVNSPSEMVFRMTVTGLGEEAQITRVRDGKIEQISVAMTVAPDAPQANPMRLGRGSLLPGLQIAQVNPALIARMGLSLNTQGVVILDAGRYAGRGGVQVGDVLLGVNGMLIETTQDAKDILSEKTRWLQLDLLRRGQRVSLRFRL